jgi:hypothetical protein
MLQADFSSFFLGKTTQSHKLMALGRPTQRIQQTFRVKKSYDVSITTMGRLTGLVSTKFYLEDLNPQNP